MKKFLRTLTADFGRWAKDAAGRALKAAIVTFSSMTAATPIFSTVESVGIYQRAAVAAVGAGISTLISLAGKWAGDPGDPSFKLHPDPQPVVAPPGGGFR